jgi:uncharacterized protein YfdQ (DUF2303 family)
MKGGAMRTMKLTDSVCKSVEQGQYAVFVENQAAGIRSFGANGEDAIHANRALSLMDWPLMGA